MDLALSARKKSHKQSVIWPVVCSLCVFVKYQLRLGGFYRIVWLNWNKPLMNLVKVFSKTVGEWSVMLEDERWVRFRYRNHNY